MSELSGRIPLVTPDPDAAEMATRAVLLRVDDGRLDPAGARRVLEALGLIDAPTGGKYTPWGARNTKGSALKRPESPVTGETHTHTHPDGAEATTGQMEATKSHQDTGKGTA